MLFELKERARDEIEIIKNKNQQTPKNQTHLSSKKKRKNSKPKNHSQSPPPISQFCFSPLSPWYPYTAISGHSCQVASNLP